MPLIQIGSRSFYGHDSRDTFMRDVAEATEIRERTMARAWKHLRLPEIYGTPASSALTMGQNPEVGPESGYAWSIRRLVIDGLTSGATPDVINLYRNSTAAIATNAATPSAPLWQFNGNNFGYTFGRLELVLKDGDVLMAGSVGTFAATGRIRISGELIEVPSEQLFKLE